MGEHHGGKKLVETLSISEPIRSIPIIEPQAVHQIGLVVPRREPMTPLTATLFAEAKKLIAPQFSIEMFYSTTE